MLPSKIAAVLDIRQHRRWHARAPMPPLLVFASGAVTGALLLATALMVWL